MKYVALFAVAVVLSVPGLAAAEDQPLPWSSPEALIEHAPAPETLTEETRLERLADSKAELGRTSQVLRDADRALAILEHRLEDAHVEDRAAIQRRIDGIERERAEARAERSRAQVRVERLLADQGHRF